MQISETIRMAISLTPAQYKQAFIIRLKAIREAHDCSQSEFAKLLGIQKDTYAKYESRSLLPHHLISKVCDITGHDPYFLLTGKPPRHNANPETIQKAG